MDPETQERADRLLEQALVRTGVPDPRASYRLWLRELKGRTPSEYEAAVRDVQEGVLRPIAEEGADPLSAWLTFGVRLAERLFRGRTVVVDAAGRARSYEPPPSWTELTLHLPEDRKARGVGIGFPAAPTRAQSAAVDLLVLGKVKLPSG